MVLILLATEIIENIEINLNTYPYHSSILGSGEDTCLYPKCKNLTFKYICCLGKEREGGVSKVHISALRYPLQTADAICMSLFAFHHWRVVWRYNWPGFHLRNGKAVFYLQKALQLENLKVYWKLLKRHQGQDQGQQRPCPSWPLCHYIPGTDPST